MTKRAQELSEAELWALDDKQREEHFRLDERRRRAEVERARRIVERIKLLPTSAVAPVTPSPATATTTAVAPTTPDPPSAKERGTAAAAAAAGGASAKNAEGAPDG